MKSLLVSKIINTQNETFNITGRWRGKLVSMVCITALLQELGNLLSELSNIVTSSNSGHHSNKLHVCSRPVVHFFSGYPGP